MKRDLIDELGSNRITAEEAEVVFDQWLDSGGTQPEKLGFSQTEYTAYCHGAGLDVLAVWRTQGWPKDCSICGKAIGAVTDFGWFVWDQHARKTGNYGGKVGLAHIQCLLPVEKDDS
jgi:hypothetical protein